MPDWITLSKTLPQLVYPLNIGLLLLVLALTLVIFGKRWKGATFIFIALTVLGVGSSTIAEVLYQHHEQRYPAIRISELPQVDAIVVLGGDLGIPSPPRLASELQGNRLLHALRLFRVGKAPMIMISGGNMFPQAGLEGEAVYSKLILEEMGVPGQAILTEDDSRNTRENALNARRILGGLGADRILLVTSGIHMPRAVKTFEKSGFDVLPAPSNFSIVSYQQPALVKYWPSVVTLHRSQQLIREYMGLFVYWMRGWA